MITLPRWFRRLRPPTPPPDEATYADLLAEYAEANKRANEAKRERDRLRALVDQVPEGQHGGWRKSFGRSARILDQDKARQLLIDRGIDVPMKDGRARLEVDYVGGDR